MPVNIDVKAGIAVLEIANPPLNVVTLTLTRQLSEALDACATDDAVRCLVVTGAGDRAFCAGSDITEFPDYIAQGNLVEKKLAYENEVYAKLAHFPKPTIAAVGALAYGGGLELACCCDLIVADETARFALPEIRLGAFPGSGGTFRVTRRIGNARAKEMMFLGDPITAETAHLWGLVNRVAAKGQAMALALDLAASLAKRSRMAVALCKQAIDEAHDLTEEQALSNVQNYNTRIFSEGEAVEGVRAFFEKREPSFK